MTKTQTRTSKKQYVSEQNNSACASRSYFVFLTQLRREMTKFKVLFKRVRQGGKFTLPLWPNLCSDWLPEKADGPILFARKFNLLTQHLDLTLGQ